MPTWPTSTCTWAVSLKENSPWVLQLFPRNINSASPVWLVKPWFPFQLVTGKNSSWIDFHPIPVSDSCEVSCLKLQPWISWVTRSQHDGFHSLSSLKQCWVLLSVCAHLVPILDSSLLNMCPWESYLCSLSPISTPVRYFKKSIPVQETYVEYLLGTIFCAGVRCKNIYLCIDPIFILSI